MFQFLVDLHGRAQEYGWNDPGGILAIPDLTGRDRNLIDLYGAVTSQEIKIKDSTYLGTPSRAAQDNAALYKCIMASLSVEGKGKVALVADKYRHMDFNSGTLLLKTVIEKTHTDTNATVMAIR